MFLFTKIWNLQKSKKRTQFPYTLLTDRFKLWLYCVVMNNIGGVITATKCKIKFSHETKRFKTKKTKEKNCDKKPMLLIFIFELHELT